MATMSPFCKGSLAFGFASVLLLSGAMGTPGLVAHATTPLVTARETSGRPLAEAGRATSETSSAVRPASADSIPVGSDPKAVVYDNEDRELFVANSGSLNSTVVSTVSDSTTASVSFSGQASVWPEAYDYESDLVYVAGSWDGYCAGCQGPWVAAVNGSSHQIVATNTSLEGIDSTDFITCLAYDPTTNDVYACDEVGRIIVLSGTSDTILGYLSAGSDPSAIAYDGFSGDLYVANSGSDNVSVIDPTTDTVVTSIPVGAQPDAAVFDSGDGELFVANNGSNNVSIIVAQDNVVVHNIPVGCGPEALTYSSYNQTVYVANACSDNLSGINVISNTVVSTTPVGTAPQSIAFDASNDQLYVANEGSNNLTVINATSIAAGPEYPIEFSGIGIPASVQFFVSLYEGSENLGAEYSTDGTAWFNELDGTYNYTVGTGAGEGYSYLAAQPRGVVAVNDAVAHVSVVFRFASELLFFAGGLPPTDFWQVNVTNSTQGFHLSENSNGDLMAFRVVANATYEYSVVFSPPFAQNDSSGSAFVGVDGTNISFSLPVGSSAGSSPTLIGTWIVVGISAALVVAVAVVLITRFGRRRPPIEPPPD